ncbi:interleukin-1 beta-like isoform X1 [Bufo bufo]|uniref:interleukin-1 beta-like isoform X1 n=1 Tax=Bufo bufo TaxID=8384 RepID=UPI001ABE01A3|nr:interleukin-1 beta-like isoform X1 [Bufo bufo]
MAEVPNLSDLPMDNSDNDEEFYACDIPNNMKANKYSHSHESLSKMHLQIRKPEKTGHLLKKLNAVGVVMGKLKECRGLKNQLFFYDDDLLPPVLVNESVTYKEEGTVEAAERRFEKDSVKPSEHTIKDRNDKSFKMEGDDSVVALYLAAGNEHVAVKVKLDTYFERNHDNLKRPVTVGIVGRNLYFYCTEEGNSNRVLRLMAVDINEKAKTNEVVPFIFYCRQSDRRSHYSFESAAFPDYYLSTSQKESEKVQIKQKDDQTVVMDFILSPKFI